MIQSNELRINNLVMDRGGKVLRIDWWERKGMVAQDMNFNDVQVHPMTEYVEHLQPIPLTGDWLQKFGFMNFGKSYYLKTELKSLGFYNKMKVRYDKFSNSFTVINPANSTIILRSVHHLQNLYFALTNTELVLNKQP